MKKEEITVTTAHTHSAVIYTHSGSLRSVGAAVFDGSHRSFSQHSCLHAWESFYYLYNLGILG